MKKIKILWSLPFIGFVLGYMGTYLFMQQETTITPNVIGRSLQESVAILSKQRLGIRLMREQEDVSMPEGIVLDQVPKADNKIRQNQNVFVTVSKKPSLLSVPDFLGCNTKDIQIRTSRSDIDVSSIGLFCSFPRNTCFAQYPSPGAQLIRKRMVVCVSNGSFPLFIIPNFKGFLVDQVKDFAHSNDVSLEIVHLQNVGEGHNCGNCHVIDQRPISGSIVSLEQPLQIQLQVSE